jgi:uncharacterized repeat protein (TIGR03803 family)
MLCRQPRLAPIVLLGSLAFAVPSGAATFAPSPAHGGASPKIVVYRFQGGNGAQPSAGLIAGKDGALYGTTLTGGGSPACGSGGGQPLGCGTVFKLSPTRSGTSRYTERVLYRFQSGRDGAYPAARLIIDRDGDLYGTTILGGSASHACSVSTGCGTVFKLTPGKWGYAESVLYRFRGGDDGSLPRAALLADRNGALYGTTAEGGFGCVYGCGTVFKLTPGERGFTESIIYRFRGGADGGQPLAALIAGKDDGLIGTAAAGGNPGCGNGCGVVFRLTPERTGYAQSVLYHFRGGHDGDIPVGSVIADADGALYGTTFYGGSSACGALGCGTVFKLTPRRAVEGSEYAESVLYRFQSGNDGEQPYAELIAGKDGALYGTASQGGGGTCGFGCGIAFRIAPGGPQRSESVLHHFQGSDGANPLAGLIRDESGALYGTTQNGGSNACPGGCGTVFRLAGWPE